MEKTQMKDELTTLKERAKKLGIEVKGNPSVKTLKAKIEAKLNEPVEDTVEDTVEEPVVMTKGQLKAKARRDAGVLKRVRIVCMNPNKKEWEGEIISAGNSVVGQFKKYIPFNSEEGYHVPQIIYNYLKEKECQIFTTVKGANGEKYRKGKLIKEYGIEDLPPLTEEELAELAQRQAMGNNIG